MNPRTAGLADPRETAVGEAEDLGFVDAEISRSDEVAGRVEDDAVRMGRVLASLARAVAGIFDLPAHGAEPSIGLDRWAPADAAELLRFKRQA